MEQNSEQIIEALGGTSKVAALCEVRSQSVSEWKRYGIPKARMQYLRLLCPDAFNKRGQLRSIHKTS